MGWLGNTPKLNRYQSLIDICTVEKKVFSIDIKCDALIDKTEERDNKNCLDLRVINKENTNILELEVCESSKVLDISDPVLDTDMKVPMHMVFKYTYLPPLSYGISHISMELMEDEEISALMVALNKVNINLANIRLQQVFDTEEKGYNVKEYDNFIEGINLGIITFVHSKINNMTINDDEILLDLNLSVGRISKEIQVKTEEFDYVDNVFSPELKRISIGNLSYVDISKSHDLIFLFVPEGTNVNKESLNNYCTSNDNALKQLCRRVEDLESYILDKPIEEYIKYSYDRLIFSGMFINDRE